MVRRGLLLVGIVALIALAAGIFLLVPPVAPAPGVSSKEVAAAFLGLIILVVAVLGPDFRDWL